MEKVISRYAKIYGDEIKAERFENADTLIERYISRLKSMYSTDDFKQNNEAYPTMNIKLIYAVIAMCLELKEIGLQDPEIISFSDRAFRKRKKVVAVIGKVANQLPNAFELAKKWNIGDHENRVKDGSITYDYFTVTDNKVEYKISGCKYVDIFESYGIRGLCKIFCNTDTQAYSKIPKHVQFIRHSDLSDGDSCWDEIIKR
ncbi:L-2-amino-thiazoline-4-carboxylic acid hydrolase [Pseudobutyrivibrio sp.]|uniref:L-2-amino-thiazoline-4-carboxylic acid hydrolase n=1 Tax=Pseudobutyrivibrio sp. TaxID=2014367 RepID=UPI001B400035|nr:L-2-amino-thiazoline-4-carboxylic acid hydrolase [Pseudobutyrivibrio sp.]MBP3261223.1 L-2-amino-thiazoline-4-carboxylic acid hydrolase [Pseudobutyrivibrio sp.]